MRGLGSFRVGRRIAMALAASALACGTGACGKGAPTQAAASVDAGTAYDPIAVAKAEDLRRAKDIGEALRTSHDVTARRRASRALARIADASSLDALRTLLEDEDEETAAWAAYGLGFVCKGNEEAHVRALAARSASLGEAKPGDTAMGSAGPGSAGRGDRGRIDVRSAVARAVGRCGGTMAEQVLAAWVRARGSWSELAAYALGDLVARRNAMTDETAAALLDAASGGAPGGASGVAIGAALYPFARLDHAPEAFAPRVLVVGRGALGRKGETRIFAIRALARSGREAIGDLARVVTSRDFTPAERAEAARGLGQLGEPGHAAAAEALAQLTPDAKDAFAITALGGDDFGVLSALITATGADVPKKAEPALYILAALAAPGGAAVPASLGRRLADIRCGAAGALSRGAYDSEVLKKCDAEGSEASERARVAALLRRPLSGERRALWRGFTKSNHVRVREAALEAIASHPELGDIARGALADALATKKGGIVSTAADVIHAHPDRVLVLADSEKRAALDPNAPPPSDTPRRAIEPSVAAALKAALEKPWTEDLVETRASILDAAVSVSLPGARDAALTACRDRNATMRERAIKALRALGDASPTCAAPADMGEPAPEIGHALTKPTRVIFTTDAGDLTMIFEPDLAPIAATRFVGLARAGFYKGIVVHRVVPGFVAQLGDPDGDGFGGSGQLLRCETSPVPFAALDVGVALAGRDTGSSQLFVTLARYPHLDGEYARVGHAEGDWWALAEGDAVRDARVIEE